MDEMKKGISSVSRALKSKAVLGLFGWVILGGHSVAFGL